jgi:hypothetical protein
MGEFYVDEDGKVFQGEKPPVNGQPSELDIKEYKFFIDEVSADRKEVRLAPQMINLDKYRDEFSSLSDEYGTYTSIKGFGSFMMGGGLTGLGKFGGINSTLFQIDNKANGDPGFKHKYLDGTLEVTDAFTVGYTEHTNTWENDDWELEGPIPTITIEAVVGATPVEDNSVTTNTVVTFKARRENGDVAPSNLSYYWDFGCGHQEFGGPEITHTYTITGNMNVSVVINSPNFVDTVTLDIPLRVSNPITPPDPALTSPTNPLDGRLIRKANGAVSYIQSGHRRNVGNWDIVWPLSVITGQYVQEQTVYNAVSAAYETNDAYVNFGFFYDTSEEVYNAIPEGPPVTIDGENGITNPNTLDLPIINGSFDEE